MAPWRGCELRQRERAAEVNALLLGFLREL
jgi:hypothetical protein